MTVVLSLASFFAQVLLRVPIGFALAIAAVVAMLLTGVPLTTMIPSRLFNGANNFSLLAIPLFILAGHLMTAAGVSQRLIDFANSLVGFIRGGLAHVNILGSMFFAELSGSAVADAAALGAVFVPEMEKRGYPRDFSAAVTSVSASISVIIPPSIPMIVYGVTAGVSIGKVFMGGVLPGVLIGIVLMTIAYVYSLKRGYPVETRFRLGEVWRTFKAAVWSLTMPLVILGGIFSGIFTAAEAGGMAVLLALLIGLFVHRELNVRDLPRIIFDSGVQTATVMVIVAASALVGTFLSMQMIPQRTAELILSYTQNPVAVLALMNVLFLIVGLFLHSAAAIVMVVPVVLPLIQQLGIDPIHFGVVVAVNLAIGQQTPPVGTVMLTTAQVAGISVAEIVRASFPFVLGMLAVLLLITYVPGLVLWLPNMMN